MPTLFRLLVAILFLAGLGYAALFALTVMVDPGEREITIRIPARDLRPDPQGLPQVNTRSSAPQPLVASEPEQDEPAEIAPTAGADQPE